MPNGKSVALEAIDELLSKSRGNSAEWKATSAFWKGSESNEETKGDTRGGWTVSLKAHAEDLPQSQKDVLRQIKHEKRLKVFALTWNLHGKKWPEKLGESVIPCNKYHIYAVGTQECERSILASAIRTSKKKWETALSDTLGENYIMIRSHTLQAIHLALFVHRALIPFICGVRSMCVARGKKVIPRFRRMGNKGAVGVHLRIGSTRLVFVSCHLAAHQNEIARRNEDFRKIDEHMKDLLLSAAQRRNGNKNKSLASIRGTARVHPDAGTNNREKHRVEKATRLTSAKDASYVFWLGDFNYRIDHTSQIDVIKMIDQGAREELLELDQMSRQRAADSLTFGGLEEAPIHFKPTYKFKPNTGNYATKKKRVPSWTDRILFRGVGKDIPKVLSYRSLEDVRTSDHLPVEATFEISFRPNVTFQSTDTEIRGVPPGRKSFQEVFSGVGV